MDYKEKLKEALNSDNTDYEVVRWIEQNFPELKESEDERIRKSLIDMLKNDEKCYLKEIAWLEKQGEQNPAMIQWKGNNLKEVINFTGKDKNFDKWFKSFEEYEKYVHEHNDIFKLFNEDDSHYEVPVGAWIVRTPDGYNVASKAVYKQKPAGKIEPKFEVGDRVIGIVSGMQYYITEVCDDYYYTESGCTIRFYSQDNFELYKQKPAWSEEDERYLNIVSSVIGSPSVQGIYDYHKVNPTDVSGWLKSLRPQNRWKPSEQDIQLLERIFDGKIVPRVYQVTLQGIIEQLKKLREK